jgi:hypothetical protein
LYAQMESNLYFTLQKIPLILLPSASIIDGRAKGLTNIRPNQNLHMINSI